MSRKANFEKKKLIHQSYVAEKKSSNFSKISNIQNNSSQYTIETENIETENIETENIETENIETENIENEEQNSKKNKDNKNIAKNK